MLKDIKILYCSHFIVLTFILARYVRTLDSLQIIKYTRTSLITNNEITRLGLRPQSSPYTHHTTDNPPPFPFPPLHPTLILMLIRINQQPL